MKMTSYLCEFSISGPRWTRGKRVGGSGTAHLRVTPLSCFSCFPFCFLFFFLFFPLFVFLFSSFQFFIFLIFSTENLLLFFIATFRVARSTRQTRKLWLVGVAADRDAPLACPNVKNLAKKKRKQKKKEKQMKRNK